MSSVGSPVCLVWQIFERKVNPGGALQDAFMFFSMAWDFNNYLLRYTSLRCLILMISITNSFFKME
jgi:hypothetical protein